MEVTVLHAVCYWCIAMFIMALAMLALIELVEWVWRHPAWAGRFQGAPRSLRWAVYYAAVLLVVFGSVGTQKFIYAQF